MAFFGLAIEQVEEVGESGDDRECASNAFELWPENAEAVEIFIALGTQWRCIAHHGGVSPTGLDYRAARGVMKDLGMKRKARAAMLANLQVMERAALPLLTSRSN